MNMSREDAVAVLLAAQYGLTTLDPYERAATLHALNDAVRDLDKADIAAAQTNVRDALHEPLHSSGGLGHPMSEAADRLERIAKREAASYDRWAQTKRRLRAEQNDAYMAVTAGTQSMGGQSASVGGMDFGQALLLLKQGHRAARSGWNGKGMWLALQRPDAHSKMTLPYIYIEYPAGHSAYPNGSRVPWLASQTDMLAEDWEVLPDEISAPLGPKASA